MAKDKVKKVLIVERSEMGLRALETCVNLSIGFVVGFSEADKDSLLVKKALEYAKNMDGSGIAYIGAEPIEESYGNVSNIIQTAKLWGCDAIYPGYGPLAEDYVSIRKIEKANLKFIGPDSAVVEIFSNKSKSRELAQKNGFNLLEAFSLNSLDEIAGICLDEKLKYPFIVKSFFSGGGKGNYLIRNDADLSKLLSQTHIKTSQYYAEEYISGKHIEFQFVVDAKKAVKLGTRDCSCQVGFQKFLEECPAEIDDKKVAAIESKISKMLLDIGYRGVGTAEFIYDETKQKYYFLEINPRIQVEVPVTEKFFGVDLVKMQFLITGGEEINIPEKKPSAGHVIEVRIYARDIFNEFKQDSKKIEKLVLPEMDGVAIFSGYEEGDVIPLHYDPLLLKIVSSGNSRKESIIRLKKALQEFRIEGPVTNKELILWLISTDEFRHNQINQDFTRQAWNKYLKNRNSEIESFLEKGAFVEHMYGFEMDPDKFPNKLRYSKSGITRDYIKELKAKHRDNPEKCAFRFGVFEKEGVACVFAWWDFSYFGGTLGVDEAMGIRKCFKLASRKNFPILMVSNSGGARQQENSFALQAMHYIVAVRKKYGVPLFVNIYYKDNFGGVNASIVEQADIKIAVKTSRIGLTGTRFLSKVLTRDSVYADDQSALQHYQARNIDLIASSFEDACEQALSMFGLLFYSAKKDQRKHGDMDDELIKTEKVVTLGLVEILKLDSGIFENVVLLCNKGGDTKTFPAIAGAFVEMDGIKALVLGQYVPLDKKADGNIDKKYIYPRAVDFKWFRRKMQLAEKLNIPIILLGDTAGADASIGSEYDGISYYISNSLSDQLELTVPVISVNMGLCGSGGGLPFVNTADFAIAFENSLKLVSNIDIQSSIITGMPNPTDRQQADILKQLFDATTKFQKKYRFVDEVISEKNKKEIMLLLRKSLKDGLKKLSNLDADALLTNRFKRIERVMKQISK